METGIETTHTVLGLSIQMSRVPHETPSQELGCRPPRVFPSYTALGRNSGNVLEMLVEVDGSPINGTKENELWKIAGGGN